MGREGGVTRRKKHAIWWGRRWGTVHCHERGEEWSKKMGKGEITDGANAGTSVRSCEHAEPMGICVVCAPSTPEKKRNLKLGTKKGGNYTSSFGKSQQA